MRGLRFAWDAPTLVVRASSELMVSRGSILRGLLGLLGLGLVTRWAVACSGEESFMLTPLDAGAPSERYETVCTGWAQRECAHLDACPVSFFARWEDDTQCIDRETLACELQAADPGVPFDPALVAGCEFGPDCADARGLRSPPDSASLCLPPGKVPDGAACVWNSACQSGGCAFTYGQSGSLEACGTCQSQATCHCAPGQSCVFLNDGGLACATLPDAGEPCGPPYDACNDATCIEATPDASPVCTIIPEAAVGAPCINGPVLSGCGSPSGDLFCDSTNHCRQHAPAAYGQPCLPMNGGEGDCLGKGFCDFGGTGLCQAPVADGEPCDEQEGLWCLPPARCIANECLFPNLTICSL